MSAELRSHLLSFVISYDKSCYFCHKLLVKNNPFPWEHRLCFLIWRTLAFLPESKNSYLEASGANMASKPF